MNNQIPWINLIFHNLNFSNPRLFEHFFVVLTSSGNQHSIVQCYLVKHYQCSTAQMQGKKLLVSDLCQMKYCTQVSSMSVCEWMWVVQYLYMNRDLEKLHLWQTSQSWNKNGSAFLECMYIERASLSLSAPHTRSSTWMVCLRAALPLAETLCTHRCGVQLWYFGKIG